MNKKRIALTLLLALLSEIANKLVPLVTLHFVATRLGASSFGVAQFALWLIDWGIFFTVYGFAQVAPIMLRNATTPEILKEVHGNVIVARLLLSLLAGAALVYAVSFKAEFAPYRTAVLSSLLILFTTAIDSAWILLARQKMALWSVLSIAAKLASLVAILVFIESPDHGVRFVMITSMANAFMSVASFAIALKLVGIRLPTKEGVVSSLKIATPFAASSLLMGVIERFDLYLVEQNFDSHAIGVYAAASKLVSSLTPIIFMITTIFYSEMIAQRELESIQRHVKASIFWAISVVSPAMVGVWFVDTQLLNFIFGSEYTSGNKILSILVNGTGLYVVITIFGFQLMTLKGLWRPLVKALTIGAISGVAFGMSTIEHSGIIGAAYASMLARFMAGSIIMVIALKVWMLDAGELLKTALRSALPAIVMGIGLFLIRRLGLLDDTMMGTIALGICIYTLVFAIANASELKLIIQKTRQAIKN